MEKRNKTPFYILLVLIVSFFVGGAVCMICGFTNEEYLLLVILGVVLIVVGVILMSVLISIYNTMVKYRNKVKEAIALVDIHLKMRFDVVPNLVNVVKGYAEHEKKTLEKVIRLRNKAVGATGEKEKIDGANKLLSGLKTLFSVVENYPDLKASKVYRKLMNQLAEIEDKIAASRRIYDSNVNEYNNSIQKFPANLFAGGFGFEKSEYFKIDSGEEIVPEVRV